MQVEALAVEDTGAILVMLEERAGPGEPVLISELPAGRPGERPRGPAAAVPGSVASPCASFTAFFLQGMGRAPSGPLIAHIRKAEHHEQVLADPRRHTLRLKPVLRFSVDTMLAGDAVYSLSIRMISRDTARLIMVGTTAAGRYTLLTVGGPADEESHWRLRGAMDWAVYLLDDRASHQSPCRGAPPRPPVSSAPLGEDWTARYVSSGIDSVLAAYDIPPLRTAAMRRGERELRITTGGGMMYGSDYVMRIVERRGRVRGELYETWRRFPGKPYAGGPFDREKRPPEPFGCLSPRITPDRWVCRIDRMLPVDWHTVLARLDALGADRLPPQMHRAFVTDMGHVIVAARTRRAYNAAYYYGPQMRSDSAEARAVGVAGVFHDVLEGRAVQRPDSTLKVRSVATGELSIPSGVVMLVRDEEAWRELWRSYPSAVRRVRPRSGIPRIDFERHALLVVGQGKYDGCASPPDYVRRVEARGDTVYVIIEENRPKRWDLECEPDPAPVQVVAFPAARRTPVVVGHAGGRYWPPRRPPGSPLP